jgi:hypothetical protein
MEHETDKIENNGRKRNKFKEDTTEACIKSSISRKVEKTAK